MIDNVGVAFLGLSAIAGASITYLVYRMYYLRKLFLLEANLQQKQQLSLICNKDSNKYKQKRNNT